MISRLDYELLVLYREPRPWPEDEKDDDRFHLLLDRKLVEPVEYEASSGDGWFAVQASLYKTSPKGDDALLEFEENAKRQAEQERQQRFDNKVSVLSILIPALTFLLGVWVEYRLSLIEVLVQIVP